MREDSGIPRRSALREEATNRYGKERRINHDKEFSEPVVNLELIGFGLNPVKYGRILPAFTGIQSDSITSDR